MEVHFWDLLLASLAISGRGPAVEVTFPESMFSWSGPFQANLRDLLERGLADVALPQTKKRKYGVWKRDDEKNLMRIRVPHR